MRSEDAVTSRCGVKYKDAGAFHGVVKAEIVSHCHVKAEKDGAFHLDVKAKIGGALKAKIGGDSHVYVQEDNTFYWV